MRRQGPSRRCDRAFTDVSPRWTVNQPSIDRIARVRQLDGRTNEYALGPIREEEKLLICDRKGEVKDRAAARIVGGPNTAAVRLDNRLANRQTHPHATDFGREEGLE